MRAWDPRVLSALANWRSKREGISFSSELTLDDVSDPIRVARLSRAGITEGFLQVDLWNSPDTDRGLDDEKGLTDMIKRAQRLGIQIRGGFPSLRATQIGANLGRTAIRMRYKRVERAVAELLHAPIGGRHLMPAIGSLVDLRMSPRRVGRILWRAAKAVIRRPRLLPLALTLAIYGEHYATARRIGAVS